MPSSSSFGRTKRLESVLSVILTMLRPFLAWACRILAQKAWVFGSGLMAAEIEDCSVRRNAARRSLEWWVSETTHASFEFHDQSARSGNRLSPLQEAVRR